MSRARTFQGLEPKRAEYWIGVQRGLRRAFHGETFGTPAEHELWLTTVNDDDTMRQQRGQGYRDGLAEHCREKGEAKTNDFKTIINHLVKQ